MTVLGGWFGLHKFKTHKFLHGFLYLISCGGFCVLYFFDVLAVLTGNYYISTKSFFKDQRTGKVERKEERQYFKPLKNKKLLTTIPISLIFASFVLRSFYIPTYMYILKGVGNVSQNVAREYFTKSSGLDNVSQEEFEEFLESLEREVELQEKEQEEKQEQVE